MVTRQVAPRSYVFGAHQQASGIFLYMPEVSPLFFQTYLLSLSPNILLFVLFDKILPQMIFGLSMRAAANFSRLWSRASFSIGTLSVHVDVKLTPLWTVMLEFPGHGRLSVGGSWAIL